MGARFEALYELVFIAASVFFGFFFQVASPSSCQPSKLPTLQNGKQWLTSGQPRPTVASSAPEWPSLRQLKGQLVSGCAAKPLESGQLLGSGTVADPWTVVNLWTAGQLPALAQWAVANPWALANSLTA